MKTENETLIELVTKSNPDFNPEVYDFNNRAVYSAHDPESLGASYLSIFNREEEKTELICFERRVLDFHRTTETNIDDYVNRNAAALETYNQLLETEGLMVGDANYVISSEMSGDVLVVTFTINTLVLIGRIVVRVSYVEPPEVTESEDEPVIEPETTAPEEDE